MKNRYLNVRVSQDTLTKLKELAAANNRSQGNWIETIIESEHQKLKEKAKMLQTKIERLIEKEALKTGKMGTESVSITSVLSDSELKEFDSLRLNNHYYTELEGNELYVRYTEEI
jgi:hypothetical protein